MHIWSQKVVSDADFAIFRDNVVHGHIKCDMISSSGPFGVPSILSAQYEAKELSDNPDYKIRSVAENLKVIWSF